MTTKNGTVFGDHNNTHSDKVVLNMASKNDTKNGYQKTIESVHDLQAKSRNQMKTIENQNNHKKTPLRTKLIYSAANVRSSPLSPLQLVI